MGTFSILINPSPDMILTASEESNYLFDSFDGICSKCPGFFYHLNCCEKFMFVFATILLTASLLVFLHKVLFPLIKMLFDRDRRSDLRDGAFRGWAFSTLLSGWWIYMVGFCEKGTSESLVALILRPLFSSLEQFVFHSDLIEVSECCHDSAWFMRCYTIIFGSAICISSVVAVNCLIRRGIFIVKRHIWSLIPCSRLNIFFGINDKSLCLANSIFQKKVRATEKGRNVFINFPDDGESEHIHNSLSRIFGLNSFDIEKTESIKKVLGIIINASSAVFDDKTYGEKNSYVLESNGLSRLIRLMKRARRIRLFFLSENESQNVRAAINIEQSHVLLGKGVDIYCKARRNYENLTLIDNSTNAHFHLVDDSSCAVNSLKIMGLDTGKPIAHPINYVKVNQTLGIVESQFTGLIVGFGQTGQDALRFLYEFSSFVGKDGERVPVHFRVIDRKMDTISGYVKCEMPAIGDGPSCVISGKEIELCNMDYHSAAFWQGLEVIDTMSGKSFIEELNCVVVAVGSDEENIALATQLYEFAIRHKSISGKAGDNLKIYVRAYNPEEESRLRKVEEYYGRESDVIKVFGYLSDIYAYDVIITNQMQKDAEEFFLSYNSTIGDNATWASRHEKLRKGTINERVEVRHKEHQDISNALHKYTKLKLLGITASELPARTLPSDYPFISEEVLSSIMAGNYKFLSEEDKDTMLWHTRLQNVSKCEHLRWNAAHYMLGYLRYGNDKDFRLRRHRCLVGWNQTDADNRGNVRELLNDSTKKYDYKVVETTVDQFYKKIVQFKKKTIF